MFIYEIDLLSTFTHDVSCCASSHDVFLCEQKVMAVQPLRWQMRSPLIHGAITKSLAALILAHRAARTRSDLWNARDSRTSNVARECVTLR